VLAALMEEVEGILAVVDGVEVVGDLRFRERLP